MARYYTTRYWKWDAHPATPFIERALYEDEVPGNPNGTLIAVGNPFPVGGATLIDQAEYDSILAAEQAPKDLYEQMQDDLDANVASVQAQCAVAYQHLIDAGVPAASAEFITGYHP